MTFASPSKLRNSFANMEISGMSQSNTGRGYGTVTVTVTGFGYVRLRPPYERGRTVTRIP
jgi:hypothetical protein